jgi:hypothetical protein
MCNALTDRRTSMFGTVTKRGKIPVLVQLDFSCYLFLAERYGNGKEKNRANAFINHSKQ